MRKAASSTPPLQYVWGPQVPINRDPIDGQAIDLSPTYKKVIVCFQLGLCNFSFLFWRERERQYLISHYHISPITS